MINQYDVIVIGGGPAGSSLATFLARKDYKVLLLEREKFPRFPVGESLLPGTQRIWNRLGIAEPLQHFGQTFKYGGDFRIGLDPKKSEYEETVQHFRNIPSHEEQPRPYAYQVERSEFDLFLLNHARQQGVTVFEEATVRKILWEGDRATGILWKLKDGTEYTTKCKCLADCSGRYAMIARSRKFLKSHETIKTSAVFAHFKNASRDEGIRQGYFSGYFVENGWIWFIPLHRNLMSVGVVMNEPETCWWSQKSPEEIMMTYINRYKFIRDRLENSEQYSKVKMLRGLPYQSERSVGDGWIAVGDANFFVDPLYSSGVHIAFDSSEKAADAIDGFLRHNRDIKFMLKYETWSKGYQFRVFTTMSMIYRLLQHKTSTEAYVKLTGKYGNHWNNPFLSRLAAWGTGYGYDKYNWVVYISWIVGTLLIWLGKLREKIFNIPAWDTHSQFCSESPLVIPKAAEFYEHEQKESQNQITPPTVVHECQHPENWIVPQEDSSAQKKPEVVAALSQLD